MSLFIVTYDVNAGGNSDRKRLQHEIVRLGGEKLSESCYALEISSDASSVFTHLRKLTDHNDSLFVIEAGFGRQGTRPIGTQGALAGGLLSGTMGRF